MTREQAKERIPHLGCYNGDVFRVIEAIYDDFESRTCENCKWYINRGCGKIIENCIFPLPYNFGCNKWEKKDGQR